MIASARGSVRINMEPDPEMSRHMIGHGDYVRMNDFGLFVFTLGACLLLFLHLNEYFCALTAQPFSASRHDGGIASRSAKPSSPWPSPGHIAPAWGSFARLISLLTYGGMESQTIHHEFEFILSRFFNRCGRLSIVPDLLPAPDELARKHHHSIRTAADGMDCGAYGEVQSDIGAWVGHTGAHH